MLVAFFVLFLLSCFPQNGYLIWTVNEDSETEYRFSTYCTETGECVDEKVNNYQEASKKCAEKSAQLTTFYGSFAQRNQEYFRKYFISMKDFWEIDFYVEANRTEGNGSVFWFASNGKIMFDTTHQKLVNLSGNVCTFMKISRQKELQWFNANCSITASYVCERYPTVKTFVIPNDVGTQNEAKKICKNMNLNLTSIKNIHEVRKIVEKIEESEILKENRRNFSRNCTDDASLNQSSYKSFYTTGKRYKLKAEKGDNNLTNKFQYKWRENDSVIDLEPSNLWYLGEPILDNSDKTECIELRVGNLTVGPVGLGTTGCDEQKSFICENRTKVKFTEKNFTSSTSATMLNSSTVTRGSVSEIEQFLINNLLLLLSIVSSFSITSALICGSIIKYRRSKTRKKYSHIDELYEDLGELPQIKNLSPRDRHLKKMQKKRKKKMKENQKSNGPAPASSDMDVFYDAETATTENFTEQEQLLLKFLKKQLAGSTHRVQQHLP